MSQDSSIDTSATVAIVVVAIVIISLCLLWTFRKSNRATLLRIRQRMFRRPNSIRLSNNTDHTEETAMASTGNIYGINAVRFSPRNPDLTVCPFTPSYDRDVHVSSQSHPPSPPSAYVPGSGALLLQDISRGGAEDKNITETDSERNGRRSVRVTFQFPNLSSPISGEHLKQHSTPGLRPCRLEIHTDIPGGDFTQVRAETVIVGMENSETFIANDNLNSSYLPSPVHTSCYPRLSSSGIPQLSSSLSLDRGLTVETGMACPNFQVPSPPPTPPTISSFSTQSYMDPEIRKHGSFQITDETNWSDVLSLAEYEREEYRIHARKARAFSLRKYLPSPPPTPTFLFTPASPPSLTHVQAEASYEYQSLNIEVGNDIFDVNDDLPPYQGLGFDYETRLSLKRATSLLAKPATLPVDSTTRILLRQVASVVKPRPPLVDFEPLLLRTVDRSRVKARALLNGFTVTPGPYAAVKAKMPVLIRRNKMEFGTRSEISPHVQVLELLIEQAGERRTGDIPLGTV